MRWSSERLEGMGGSSGGGCTVVLGFSGGEGVSEAAWVGGGKKWGREMEGWAEWYVSERASTVAATLADMWNDA